MYRKKVWLIIFIALTLISCSNSIRVNDEFTIEYMEMYSSISLRNKNQGFVSNIKEAYWNSDSLVASGDNGCFLIIFGKTKYNDEMIRVDCDNLNERLKISPIYQYKQQTR